MKIEKLEIPRGYLNMQESVLTGLGELVLLTGPNGGGKSRVLQALTLVGEKGPGNLAHAVSEHDRMRREREQLQQRIEQRHVGAAAMGPDPTQELERLQPQWLALEERLRASPSFAPSTRVPTVVDLTQTGQKFPDPQLQSRESAGGSDRTVRGNFSVESAIQHGLSAVTVLIEDWIRVGSPRATVGEERREEVNREVEELNELTLSLLGTKFEMGLGSEGVKLFGHPVSSGASLSSGQRILLTLVFILHFQNASREDLVLIWDEPELHLHPDAVVDVVERVRKARPEAQLWIATHSVHLLAHYRSHGIWFAQKGRITRAGRAEQDVLTSLLGGEAGIDELSEFLALPAQRSMRTFAAQCLLPPPVVDTPAGDPQTWQIYVILRDSTQGRSIKALDFGAGKGRLVAELIEARKNVDPAAKEIEYFAYDLEPPSETQQLIKSRFAEAGWDAETHYMIGEAGMALSGWAGMFDAVIVCNALHEIELDAFKQLFGRDGTVTRCLKDSGHLLVVEDYVLAAGERAHQFGFMLFDRNDLRALFQAADNEMRSFDSDDERYLGRLKAHLIPKAALARFSDESLNAALESVRDRSLSEAESCHACDASDPKAGHRLAVAAHQHLNAVLALQAMATRQNASAVSVA